MMSAILIAVLSAMSVGAPPTTQVVRAGAPMSREEFAKQIKRISVRMSAEEVRAVLGPPDDIRTPDDFGNQSFGDFKELWNYGTDGHNTFPTLGRVWFGEKGEVKHVFGAESAPPASNLIDETRLREVLRKIDRVTEYAGGPLARIQATNALQRLGRERGTAALREYVRVRTSPTGHDNIQRDEGFMLLLRTLFEVPADPGYMPKVGGFDPYPPEDPWIAPLWPIVIVDGLPLVFANTNTFGNGLRPMPQFPDPMVEEYISHCGWRSEPLKPTNRPLDVLGKVQGMPQWTFGQDDDFRHTQEQGRDLIGGQLLQLLQTVYRGKVGDSRCDPKLISMDQALAEVAKLEIRWDDARDQYVYRDGSSLPEKKPGDFARTGWKPEVPGWEITISLHREDEEQVEVTLRYSGRLLLEAPRLELGVYPDEDRNRQISSLDIPGSRPPMFEQPAMSPEMQKVMEESRRRTESGKMKAITEGRGTMSGSTWTRFELKPGRRIVAILTYGGETWTSPVFEP